MDCTLLSGVLGLRLFHWGARLGKSFATLFFRTRQKQTGVKHGNRNTAFLISDHQYLHPILPCLPELVLLEAGGFPIPARNHHVSLLPCMAWWYVHKGHPPLQASVSTYPRDRPRDHPLHLETGRPSSVLSP
jgi:hypothetical protein